MGTQMLVIMGLFTFGGYWLDKWLGFSIPVFTVALSLIGIFAAFYLTLKDLLKTNKKEKK
jgi:apolipoprotein N-acyltransferase